MIYIDIEFPWSLALLDIADSLQRDRLIPQKHNMSSITTLIPQHLQGLTRKDKLSSTVRKIDPFSTAWCSSSFLPQKLHL